MAKVGLSSDELELIYNRFQTGIWMQSRIELSVPPGVTAEQVLEEYKVIKQTGGTTGLMSTIVGEDDLVIVNLTIRGFEKMLKKMSLEEFLEKVLKTPE